MLTPVVRMVAAALADPSKGVVAKLAALTADGSDTVPTSVSIVNAADHPQAVSPDVDSPSPFDDWPVLVVAADAPSKVVVTGVVGQAFDIPNLLVVIAFITGDTGDQSQAWRDADYTFRAVALALDSALLASDTAAARVRGKVSIVKHNSMIYGPSFEKLRKGRLIGLFNLELWVRVRP